MILDKIVASKEVKNLPSTTKIYDLIKQKEGLFVLGEIKKASPSKGLIREDFNVLELAKEYEGNVDLISVLTEENYFQGSLSYLKEVSTNVSTPTLRKDFIKHIYEIKEAKEAGASLVLLIVAMLTYEQLELLYEAVKLYDLEALVEVHNKEELDLALKLGCNIIGINNRNLHTFEVSLDTTLELVKYIPSDKVVISESGMHTKEDIDKIRDYVDGVLIGESFMRASSIQAHKEFLGL